MEQMYRPQRQSQELSIQHVGDETLIYDERRHLAFCLNRISAAVWRLCDGAHSVAQIAAALEVELAQPVTDEIVLTALTQMEGNGLILAAAKQEAAAGPAAEIVEVAGNPLSRRDVMSRLALGAAVLVPAIAILAAPPAVMADSLDDGGFFG